MWEANQYTSGLADKKRVDTCTCMTKNAVATMKLKCSAKGRMATGSHRRLAGALLLDGSIAKFSIWTALLLCLRVMSST